MKRELHPATEDLVQRFAQALAEKLAVAEEKYGYSDGWLRPGWMNECRAKLLEHVAKGDPRDVAAYCAFLWHHGESSALASREQAGAVAEIPQGALGTLSNVIATLRENGRYVDEEGEPTDILEDLHEWLLTIAATGAAIAAREQEAHPEHARALAEHILSMDLATEKGQHARALARKVLEGEDESPAELALRSLASWLGCGGYNATAIDAEVMEQRIRDAVSRQISTDVEKDYGTLALLLSKARTWPKLVNVPDADMERLQQMRDRLGAITLNRPPLAAPGAAIAAREQTPSEQVERIVHLRTDRARRVYIAGPMTGLPELNFPLFNAVAANLRAAGWHVENPAEHGHIEDAGWADYLRWDISRLTTCGSIWLLPGWSSSKGAKLEVHIAKTLGLQIEYGEGADREEAPTGQSITLDDDLIAILGRPNFTCIRIAQALRLCGVDIKPKAEHEQAAVIHFLLTRYLRHGSDWATHSDADLRAMLDQAEAKNTAAMAQPVAAPLETGEGDANG
jgi:hypothetical protein